MSESKGMKISIVSNENPKAFIRHNPSFQYDLSSDVPLAFKKNKSHKWHLPIVNKVSLNDKFQSTRDKSKNQKEIDYESGLKKAGANRNKYTMNHPYILNKDMMFFIKDDYEGGYIPNRTGRADFSTIKSPKHNLKSYPKTTKFLNHKDIPIKLTSNDSKNTLFKTNCFSSFNICQCNKGFNMKNPNTTRSKSSFGFPFLNHSKNKQLYLQLDQSQREMLTDYIDLFNSKNNETLHKKNCSLNNLTTFLDLAYKDRIPLTFPKCISSIETNLTKGEKHRYDKIIDELLKVKYLISLDRGNERLILKEFLHRHGVFNDYKVSEAQLTNFGSFIQGEWDCIDMNRTFKEILIGATLNQYTNRQSKDNEASIEEQFPTEDTKEKEIPSSSSVHSRSRSKNTRHKADIYSKLSLSKQKLLYVNESKGMNEIAKDLEAELMQLKVDHWQQKGNKTFSFSIFPRKHLASKSLLYLTQSKSLVRNEVNSHSNNNSKENKKKRGQKFILSHHASNSQSLHMNHQLQKDSSSIDNKIDKLSIKHLNDRFYYSGLNKNDLSIKAIKSHKKFTEYIVLKRTKRRLALEKLKDFFR